MNVNKYVAMTAELQCTLKVGRGGGGGGGGGGADQ